MELPRISLEQVKKMENGDPSETIEQMIIQTSLAPLTHQELLNIPPPKPASTVSPPQTLGDLNLVLRTDSSSSDDSDSDDDDDEDLTPTPMEIISNNNTTSSSKTKSSGLPEKRRRSQPVKFEPSPISPKQHVTRQLTPKSVPSRNYTPGKLRGTRCGRCQGCQQEDCGKCVFCKDKPKFGGPGKKKQRCKERTCTNFQHRTGDKYALRHRATGPIKPYPTKNGEALFDGPSTSAGPSAAVGRRAGSLEKQVVSGQLTYNKVAKQLASTKPSQGAKIELEKTPVAQPTTSTSSAVPVVSSVVTVPPPVPVVDIRSPSALGVAVGNMVKPVPMDTTPTTSSTSGVAKTTVASLLSNIDKFDSSVNKSMPKLDSSVNKSTPKLDSSVNKSTPKLDSSVNKSTPKLDSSMNKGTLKPVLVNAKVEVKKVPDRMTCVQCGRDRPLSIAKTDQFCTQRCINNWQESQSSQQTSQPEAKAAAADEAAGAGPASSTGDSPFKPLPRALRNLQIDMAKPGTKLTVEEENKTSTATSTSASTASSSATRSSLINSLASMISQSQTQADPPKPLMEINTPPSVAVSVAKAPEVAKTVTPAKVAAKRSSNIQLVSSAAKKAKMATKAIPQTTPKSVSFNLKPNENGTTNSSSPNHSNVLPLIASMFQPSKKSHDSVKVKLPSNLPTDIRQWTVGHVIHYFKSTADCQDYIELFEAQEVDGIALLLLTHETLVKCLGIKLGRALKIMNRVQELKRYQEHKSTK